MNSKKYYSKQDIASMERVFRLKLINCLSGFKSANLIGTIGHNDQTNLSIVSSVFHLGANPALIGFVMRPHTTARHTWENILENQTYTINHVNSEIAKQSHQTSARYPRDVSEFAAVGLTEEFVEGQTAPYVKESHIKLGMLYKDHLHVELNDTVIVIGEIQHIYVPHQAIMEDGFIDIEAIDTVAVSGLDRYHKSQAMYRLSYAKTDKDLDII